MPNVYIVREWMTGKLVSHQFDLDDADIDARIHACETLRGTYVVGPDGKIISHFEGSTGNRLSVSKIHAYNIWSKS